MPTLYTNHYVCIEKGGNHHETFCGILLLGEVIMPLPGAPICKECEQVKEEDILLRAQFVPEWETQMRKAG